MSILAMPISEVVLPHFYGKVIYNIQKGVSIKQYILPIIIFLILVQSFYILNDFIEIKLYPRMLTFIRNICTDKIVNARSTELKEMEIGKILAKLVRFPTMLYGYIETFKDKIIPYILIYIFAIIYMAFKDWMLSLLILIVTICILFANYKSMLSCLYVSQIRDKYYNKVFEDIDEIMRNMVSVLNNNNYEYESSRLDRLDNEFRIYAKKSLDCINKYKFTFYAILATIIVVFVYRVLYLYHEKELTIPSIITIVIIMIFLYNTMMKHANDFKDLMFRYGTIQESLGLFSEEGKQSSKKVFSGDVTYSEVSNSIIKNECINLKNITFAHNGKAPILKNFYLDINCRQNLAIMGEIGSGKSSILQLIMRYYIPEYGEIYLNGVPYSSMSESKIRDKIGYVHQTPILFNRTLMENIKYGKRNATDEDVENLIIKLEVVDIINKFPKRLETMAGKGGSNLSGGERQIIWILRVLLHDPEIIIMDEPSSAMDPQTRDTLFHIITKLLKEKTVISVTHDKALLQYFDRVIIMKDGKIIKDNLS
jgi:ABC-type multidrug transport system fused ATPase/permease subunit